MAVKIDVEVENNASSGLRAVAQDLGRVEGAADDAGAAMRSLGGTDDAIDDLANEVWQLNHQIGDLIDLQDKAQKELRQTAEASKGVGNTAGGFTKLGLGVIGVNQALEISKKAAELTGRAISAAAEDGSPAFQGLMESVGGVQNALLDLADDPAVQDMIAGLTTSINESLIPSIQSIPDAWRQFNDDASRTFAYLGESVGLFAKGTLEANEEIIASNDKLSDQRKEEIAAERERIAVDEKLAKLRDKMQADQELAAIVNIDNAQILKDLIGDEEDALREMVRSGERDRDKQEAAFKRIEAAEKALIDLPKKRADAINKETERNIANLQAEKARWEDLIKSVKEAGKEVTDAKDSAKKDAADKATADLRNAIREAKAMQSTMSGGGAGGGNLIDSITGQFSDATVKKQFVRNKADAAEAQVRADQRLRMGEDGKLTGLLDQNGEVFGNTAEERRLNQRKLDRQIADARRSATIQASRQARTVGITPEESAGIRGDLALSKATQAKGMGLIDDKTFAGLRDQLKESLDSLGADMAMQRQTRGLQLLDKPLPPAARTQRIADAVRNAAGGPSVAADDATFNQLLTAQQGLPNAVGGLTQTVGNAVADLYQQSTMLQTQVASIQQQIAAAQQVNRQSAARTKAQRGGY